MTMELLSIKNLTFTHDKNNRKCNRFITSSTSSTCCRRLFWIIMAILSLISNEGWCLRDVQLLIIPPAVQRGGSAILLCQYNLEGAPLYSVSWYRGTHEFYRYSPSEIPMYKVFSLGGIHVDETLSNSTQVVLQDISFSLSGTFNCEVTTDAPTFSTQTVSSQMTVVEYPESPPVLMVERDRYNLGDILRANCTSPPSRPPAELTFHVNGLEVGATAIERHSAENLLLVGGNGGVMVSGGGGGGGIGHRWSSPSLSLSSPGIAASTQFLSSTNSRGNSNRDTKITNSAATLNYHYNTATPSNTQVTTTNGLQWSTATLNLQLLPMHFGGLYTSAASTSNMANFGTGGTGSAASTTTRQQQQNYQRNIQHANMLQVTCTAHIPPSDYQRTASVQLTAGLGEPIHQRVMSAGNSNVSILTETIIKLLISISVVLVTIHYHHIISMCH